jgi:hypothetical protein
MDSVIFWIFLWLILTLSLNKIKNKIKHRFRLFVMLEHVASPLAPFHDLTLICN